MKFAAKLLVLGTLFAGGIAFAEATDPDVKARQELMKANGAAMKTLSDMGLSVGYMSPAELARREAAYRKVWSRIIQESGFKPL